MNVKQVSLLLVGGVLLAVLVYGGGLLYLLWPINTITIDQSGVFGDSFGFLTSLFSGLAFAGLIITILMQKDALALQRDELLLTRQEMAGQKEELRVQNETMRTQRFENTFFKMLDFLSACRNDVFYLRYDNQIIKGRDSIKGIYNIFVDNYLHDYARELAEQKIMFKEECKTLPGIKKAYNYFYARESGEELGQYYRTLYNILKLVDRNDFIPDKKIYTNLLRAQLSRYELSLLFYNCLSDFGSEKMAPLIKRYAILKHLEDSSLPHEHLAIWQLFYSESDHLIHS